MTGERHGGGRPRATPLCHAALSLADRWHPATGVLEPRASRPPLKPALPDKLWQARSLRAGSALIPRIRSCTSFSHKSNRISVPSLATAPPATANGGGRRPRQQSSHSSPCCQHQSHWKPGMHSTPPFLSSGHSRMARHPEPRRCRRRPASSRASRAPRSASQKAAAAAAVWPSSSCTAHAAGRMPPWCAAAASTRRPCGPGPAARRS